MTAVLLTALATLAGFSLLSLTVPRHRQKLLRTVFGQTLGSYALPLLRAGGWLCLVLSFFLALADNVQLGALYWAAYAMVAGLVITAIHSYAER